MPRVHVRDKSLIHQVWKLLDQHVDPVDIADGIEPSQRTVERLRAAKNAFQGNIPNGEIARSNGWSDNLVRELKGYWIEYCETHPTVNQTPDEETVTAHAWVPGKDVKVLLNYAKQSQNSWHLERLREALNTVRRCLYNPHLEWEPYIGVGRPLALVGRDWSLIPVLWFHAVTPDFSDEKLWRDTFPSLKEHLRDSPFWVHLDELYQLAERLENDLDDAALEYGSQDREFLSSWEELKKKIAWCLPESRVPDDPDVDCENVKLPSDDDYTQWVCSVLKKGPMPNIYPRQWELVKKLEELNKDLEPDIIENILVRGRCSRCFIG